GSSRSTWSLPRSGTTGRTSASWLRSTSPATSGYWSTTDVRARPLDSEGTGSSSFSALTYVSRRRVAGADCRSDTYTRPMPETLRAVTYIRLSSYAGEDDPTTSPQRQREATSGYCAAKGWEVVEVIEDIGVSGSDRGLRLDRPGLRRVRELLPTVDVLVFARLDRLARNVIDFRAFAEEAERHGVALVSVAESLDLTTPTGRFVATILASFAEMEAAVIADRTRAGRLRAIADGRWTGGVRPFGFRAVDNPDGPGKVLVVDDAEAELLRAGV